MTTLELFNKYPELIDITSGDNNKKISYGIHNLDFINGLVSIYTNYFKSICICAIFNN